MLAPAGAGRSGRCPAEPAPHQERERALAVIHAAPPGPARGPGQRRRWRAPGPPRTLGTARPTAGRRRPRSARAGPGNTLLVERWVRELTEKAIRRGVFKSVPDLIAAIEAYLQANNNDPKPFVWTATAEEILEKVSRGRVALASIPANNETPH
jgi:hypothetical protein